MKHLLTHNVKRTIDIPGSLRARLTPPNTVCCLTFRPERDTLHEALVTILSLVNFYPADPFWWRAEKHTGPQLLRKGTGAKRC